MDKIFIIKIIIFSIGTGLGLYFARYIKPFLIWIKGGIEDGDGKLENKELQIAFFSILSAFMIISIAIWGINYPDIAYYGVFGGAGVLYAVNRVVEGWKSTHDGKKESNEGKPPSNDYEE